MKAHYQNLEYTLRVLAASNNDVVVPVLLAALDSEDACVRDGVFPILLQRRSPEAENEILRRWPDLSGHWKQLVIRREDWLSPAVRQALLGNDLELAKIACAAAAELGDYEIIPVLATVACDKRNAVSPLAAGTLLVLAERLAEEASTPRDYRNRKDSQLQRAHLLGSLEKGVQAYDQHQRQELIEALLILSSRDNAVVSRVLQEPAERAFAAMMDLLIHSSRPCILRLLLSFLDDPHAPLPALHAVGRRRDITWLRQLCRKVGDEPGVVVRNNLKRIDNIPWLKGHQFLIDAIHDCEHSGAVRFVTLSGVPRQEALETLAYVLRGNSLPGKRAASAALADFGGAEASSIVQNSLEDSDPIVRANLAAQLRTRGIPGSMNRLIDMLDSEHEVERQAARTSLEEFTFASYAASFDYLDEESRERTGQLVRRIDVESAALLRDELCCTSRTRKRRALEMAFHMGLVMQLQDAIANLSRDEDQYIRLEAVRLLGICPTPVSGQVLREALSDSRTLVQEAAKRGLRELAPEDEVAVAPTSCPDFEISQPCESTVTA